MKPPAITSAYDLRVLTPARVGLGRSGASLPTQALLDFTLDHARARDAVHAPFDVALMVRELESAGLAVMAVASEAEDRRTYLRRPDLGRKLCAGSVGFLDKHAADSCDLAIVLGDGLSAAAIHHHAGPVVRNLLARLARLRIGPAVVATGARVALGDDIGSRLNARMIVMFIGERPGLSAPDSLGCYITHRPRPGLTDADRNCVSNIHAAGLSYDEAGLRIAWLVREGLARGVSGVALKDGSGQQPIRLTRDSGPV
jgi:ethanolamine ammonia-lyase small subunit